MEMNGIRVNAGKSDYLHVVLAWSSSRTQLISHAMSVGQE